MGPDYIERWIIARTELIVTARLMRQKGLTIMPIEIKGLRGKALKAAPVFDRMNGAYDKLIETASSHTADVEGLAPQIDAMQDDITFAVQTLGNSVSASNAGEELPKLDHPPQWTSDTSPAPTRPPPNNIAPPPLADATPQDPARSITR